MGPRCTLLRPAMTASDTPPSLLVVDSGIGGLSVVAELRKDLPRARIAYVADNGGFPYGALADDVLTARMIALVGAGIARFNPDLVVVACNTGSTIALAALRRGFDLPFVGCVPAVKWAASLTESGCFGILATEATVRRAYLQDLIDRFAADKTVLSHGSRKLAILAERRFRGEQVDLAAVASEVAALTGQDGAQRMDTIVLGCTHFGFLLDELRQAAPANIRWLDPAGAVSRRTQVVAAELDRLGGIASDIALFTSGAGLDADLLRGFRSFGFAQFDQLPIGTGTPAGG